MATTSTSRDAPQQSQQLLDQQQSLREESLSEPVSEKIPSSKHGISTHSNSMNQRTVSQKSLTGRIALGDQAMQPLYDIFFFCKKRLDEKVIPLDEEKEHIEQISISLIVEYLKQIVNYLVKQKVRLMNKIEQFIKPDEDYLNEYESMLQKLEAECRTHIRIEQQLKICAENAQEQLEFTQKDLLLCEKSKEFLEEQLTKMSKTQEELLQMNKEREDRIDSLKARIKVLESEQSQQQQQIQQNSLGSAEKGVIFAVPNTLPKSASIAKLPVSSVGASDPVEKHIIRAQLQYQYPNENTKHPLTRIQRSVSNVAPSFDTSQRQSQIQQLLTQREVMRSIESNIGEGEPKEKSLHLRQTSSKWNQQAQSQIQNALTQLHGNPQTQQHQQLPNHSSKQSHEELVNLLGTNNGSAQPMKQNKPIHQIDKKSVEKYLLEKQQEISNGKMTNNNSSRGNQVSGKGSSSSYNSASGTSGVATTGALQGTSNNSLPQGSYLNMNVNGGGQQQPQQQHQPFQYQQSSQLQQNIIIKTITQQSTIKPASNPVIVGRIHSKITGVPLQSQQALHQNMNSSSSSSNLLQQQHQQQQQQQSIQNQAITSSLSQRSLSRSKSRMKFKEYSQTSVGGGAQNDSKDQIGNGKQGESIHNQSVDAVSKPASNRSMHLLKQ